MSQWGLFSLDRCDLSGIDPLDNILKTKEKVFHGQIIVGSATLGRVELISFLVDFSAVFSTWV